MNWLCKHNMHMCYAYMCRLPSLWIRKQKLGHFVGSKHVQTTSYVHTYTHQTSWLHILFWESEHPKQSVHLTPRVTSYICTVCTSKLTATCVYTACFDSPSTESNILTRVTYACACTAELRSWTTTNSACHQWSTVPAVFKGVAALSSAHYAQ